MVSTAPSLTYSELDLSDPDEQMKVTNNSSNALEWEGVRRIYTIPSKGTEWIPFHVVVRYLGDPRSEYRKSETFITPTGEKGVIPERRGELIRLSVMYGLYHGKIPELPKKAPKVTVTTTNDIALDFPIFHPNGTTYAYQTNSQGIIDARTEFERLQKHQMETDQKLSALMERMSTEDLDSDDPPEDSPIGV
jgi:hypothetical protein